MTTEQETSTLAVEQLLTSLRNAAARHPNGIVRINTETIGELIRLIEAQQNLIGGLQHALANAPHPNEHTLGTRYDRTPWRIR